MITRMTKCRMAWGVLKDGRKKWGSFICQKPRSWHQWSTPSWIHFCPSLNECEILDGPMDPMKSHGPQKSPMGSGEEFCKSRFYVDLRGNLRRWSFHCWWFRNPARKTTWDGAKTPVNNGRCSTTLPSTAATLNRSSNFPIDYGRDDWKSTSGAWGLSCWNDCIHPARLTWNLRIHPWKRKIIFQTIIFRFYMFYVNLRGCMLSCQAMQLVHHCQQESTQLRLGWETPMYPDFSGRDSYPAQHHQARHGTRLVKVKWWNKTMGGRRW